MLITAGAAGLDRLGDQVLVGLLGRAAAFLDVAAHAAADDVVPGTFAALALGQNVVQRQFGGGIFLAAVLAFAAVAGIDISTVEFHILPRELVVSCRADHHERL